MQTVPDDATRHDAMVLAFGELQTVLLATSSVEDFLLNVAQLAARIVDPAAACGITVRGNGRPYTVASSCVLATQVDELQYGPDEGPCLQALRTREMVEVADLEQEARWPAYRPHALVAGIRSSLSLPLTAGSIVGALNLYAYRPRCIGPHEREKAEIFASQASAALLMVVRQAEQSGLSEQLRQALSSRSVIDQALGIVMAQDGCSAPQAFATLRGMSQRTNRKLRDVATDMVERVGGEPPTPAPGFS